MSHLAMSQLAWNPSPSGATRLPAAAPSLQRWSSPRSILVVTDGQNEEMLLFHTMLQAKQSRARIVLAHLTNPGAETQPPGTDSIQRRLQWVGIHCQSTILSGPAEVSVPSLAARSGADRVLIATQSERLPGGLSPSNVTERLLPLLQVPACLIGNGVPPPPKCAAPVKRIALALSLQTRNEVALRFACELCREWNATLTVVHVFSPQERQPAEHLRTPTAVDSQLPDWIRKKTPISCPLEISVRCGDPAREIAAHAAKSRQDLILMCSPGPAHARATTEAGVLKTVLSEATCPVMVTGRGLEQVQRASQ